MVQGLWIIWAVYQAAHGKWFHFRNCYAASRHVTNSKSLAKVLLLGQLLPLEKTVDDDLKPVNRPQVIGITTDSGLPMQLPVDTTKDHKPFTTGGDPKNRNQDGRHAATSQGLHGVLTQGLDALQAVRAERPYNPLPSVPPIPSPGSLQSSKKFHSCNTWKPAYLSSVTWQEWPAHCTVFAVCAPDPDLLPH